MASGTSPEELFTAVTAEVGQLLGVEYAGLNRYESGGTAATIVALWGRAGDPVRPGGRRQLLGGLVAKALRHAEQANSELRELAHGILPAALTRGGLAPGSRRSCPGSRCP